MFSLALSLIICTAGDMIGQLTLLVLKFPLICILCTKITPPCKSHALLYGSSVVSLACTAYARPACIRSKVKPKHNRTLGLDLLVRKSHEATF